MKKIQKHKQILLGSIIILVIILSLIGLVIYRLSTYKLYGKLSIAIFIGVLVMGVFFFIKETINLIKLIRIPSVLIEYSSNYVKAYIDKKYIEIDTSSIERIDKGVIYSNSLLFYQASIVFRVNGQSLVCFYVDKLDESYNDLINTLELSINNDGDKV